MCLSFVGRTHGCVPTIIWAVFWIGELGNVVKERREDVCLSFVGRTHGCVPTVIWVLFFISEPVISMMKWCGMIYPLTFRYAQGLSPLSQSVSKLSLRGMKWRSNLEKVLQTMRLPRSLCSLALTFHGFWDGLDKTDWMMIHDYCCAFFIMLHHFIIPKILRYSAIAHSCYPYESGFVPLDKRDRCR